MKTLRLALAQINPTVGDLGGNTRKIIDAIRRASKAGALIVALPELALTGYPPEDLLLKQSFIGENLRALDAIRKAMPSGIAAVIGFVEREVDIHNSAAVLCDGRVCGTYRKMHLPNYGVFDEFRYFQPGVEPKVFKVADVMVGITICEDMWYPEGPHRTQAIAGAEVIININASPYSIGKRDERERMLRTRATDSSVVVAYLNTVGGQDELVFDGASMIIDEHGEVMARGAQFKEDLIVADIDLDAVFMRRLIDPRRRKQAEALDMAAPIEVALKPRKVGPAPGCTMQGLMCEEQEVYSALVLGLRDYVHKNKFKGGLIGLSGGVDSALVAAIAADALGPKNVTCIFMPSPYTAHISGEDSMALARALGVRLVTIPIQPIFDTYGEALAPTFKGLKPDTTEENLQARIRGNLLMAVSNKSGALVLTTGNKSEMSVGYATLYGDMAGGFAVIKDVPKTLVYRLADWRNAQEAVIPRRIITREPTAELRPDQRDTDSLPPYDVLDPILRAYIEEERSLDEIEAITGSSGDMIRRVVSLVDGSEYKRRQSPPGIKITARAFGKDRRMPITNRYRGDAS